MLLLNEELALILKKNVKPIFVWDNEPISDREGLEKKRRSSPSKCLYFFASHLLSQQKGKAVLLRRKKCETPPSIFFKIWCVSLIVGPRCTTRLDLSTKGQSFCLPFVDNITHHTMSLVSCAKSTHQRLEVGGVGLFSQSLSSFPYPSCCDGQWGGKSTGTRGVKWLLAANYWSVEQASNIWPLNVCGLNFINILTC